MAADDFRLTTHEGSQLTDEELAKAAELFNSFEAEVWPEDPHTPIEHAAAEARAVPERVRRRLLFAWAEDRLVGSAEFSIDPEDDDNPDVLSFSLYVRPEHRRRGLGTRMLTDVLALAHAEARHRLVTRTYSRISEGDSFARAVGASPKASSHTNHLPIAEVDSDLLAAWVREGPQRAPGYELLAWDGPVPERHLEAFVELMLVMNDAPRDGLELNDFTLTPQEWREGEQQAAAIGQERWMLVARRRSDGGLVGLHDVVWVPAFPNAMFIGSTGVRPEDRGHALGKWLKAAMTLRVIAERRGVTDIRTDNADSNAAMLSINDQMGYRELLAMTTWELAVA